MLFNVEEQQQFVDKWFNYIDNPDSISLDTWDLARELNAFIKMFNYNDQEYVKKSLKFIEFVLDIFDKRLQAGDYNIEVLWSVSFEAMKDFVRFVASNNTDFHKDKLKDILLKIYVTINGRIQNSKLLVALEIAGCSTVISVIVESIDNQREEKN